MNDTIKDRVRARYAEAARQVTATRSGCGCGPAHDEGAMAAEKVRASTGCCDGAHRDCHTDGGAGPFGQISYVEEQLAALPPGAVAASLGCGNPTALLDLRQGETVLDLGSGGGIDVLLSARRVGPTGKAIGLDMTDEMLALARANAVAAGATNVEFLKGEMEALPLPASSVDVVISNCVVNLSPDKDAVLREAFRVLRPGGRFAISDVIALGAAIPSELAADLASWTGCIAGALEAGAYNAKLRAAGFEDTAIEVTRVYQREDALDVGAGAAAAYDHLLARGGQLASAFIRASKPSAV